MIKKKATPSKQKGYKFKNETKQVVMKMHDGKMSDKMVKNMHKNKETFWSKATGGRMK